MTLSVYSEMKSSFRILTVIPNTKTFQLDLSKSKSSSIVAFDCKPPPKPPRNSPGSLKYLDKAKSSIYGSYHGILGLIRLKTDTYLLLVKDVRLLGKLSSFNSNEISIYQIKSIDAISLSNSSSDVIFQDLKFKATEKSNLNSYIERLGTIALGNAAESSDSQSIDEQSSSISVISDIVRYLSNGSFYFSHDINMTRSFQDSCAHKHSNNDYDDRFLWNRYLIFSFIEWSNTSPFKSIILSSNIFIYAISGFVYLDKISSLCIISRLGCYRAGTRFLTRGVDDDGHVANYVETELVCCESMQYFSLVQIRGSIPIFWEQQGLQIGQPKIQITRSFDASQPAFFSHFDHMIKHFGRISIINLLSLKDESHSESILARCYEKHLEAYLRHTTIKYSIDINDHSSIINPNEANINDTIDYHSFDFHAIVKESYEKLSSLLLNELSSVMNTFGYFVYDISQERVTRRQTGVFRINCLDCLDRTNVVQSILSRYMLKNWKNGFRILDHELNSAWADNGDALSILYTGTGALKSGYTRTGKRTISGFMDDLKKTTHRFYINNFQDKFRQRTIDWILGRIPYQDQVTWIDINNQITSHIPKITNVAYDHSFSVYVITWNVHTVSSSQVNLAGLFHPICNNQSSIPDLIIIGLQEMIEFNPQQLLGPSTSSLESDTSHNNFNIDVSNSHKSLHWEQDTLNCINKLFPASDTKYVKLSNAQLVGIYLLVIGKKRMINEIRQVETSIKRTGFGGVAGNKGSVAIRFTINSRTMYIINSHFASGQENITFRNKDYQSAWSNPGLVFPSGYRVSDYRSDSDFIIWLGDMNYRIQLPALLVQECIASAQHDLLIEYDQLNLEKSKMETMIGFNEMNITFSPTYKYYTCSNEYDMERIPGWTDRILYCGQLKGILYRSISDCIESDHRPVVALLKHQKDTETLISFDT